MYPLVRKILIADDHPITRRGLRMLINNELLLTDITEVDNFADLLKLLDCGNYSHLILDLIIQDVNTAEKFLLLRKKFPSLAILIYSMHKKEIYGPHLMRLGARGFLNKQSSDEDVVGCLKEFFSGRKCKNYLKASEDQTDNENPFNKLSQRELEVLRFLLQGSGSKEISAFMNLKPNTVATFKTRIFEKLDVKNLIELNQLASIYQVSLPSV